MRTSLAIGAALLAASPAAAAPADDFHRLMDDHYSWLLRESPTYATSLGIHDYDDRIEDFSLEARDRQAQEAKAFLARLERIPEAGLGSRRGSRRTAFASG
jgi:uncharacterized protein (DUF885 family)